MSLSPNPTAIDLFNQFDSTMDKILFIATLILTLSLLFSTIYFLYKYKFKIETFIFVSITGLVYIICTTPVLQNIHTDGFSDQPLKKIFLFTTSISLLLIIEGILTYAVITIMFKLLTVFISGDIKNALLYLYMLVIVLLLFIFIPFIFFRSTVTTFT